MPPHPPTNHHSKEDAFAHNPPTINLFCTPKLQSTWHSHTVNLLTLHLHTSLYLMLNRCARAHRCVLFALGSPPAASTPARGVLQRTVHNFTHTQNACQRLTPARVHWFVDTRCSSARILKTYEIKTCHKQIHTHTHSHTCINLNKYSVWPCPPG